MAQILVGVVLAAEVVAGAAFALHLRTTKEQLMTRRHRRVHWSWWVLWSLAFAGACLLIAMGIVNVVRSHG